MKRTDSAIPPTSSRSVGLVYLNIYPQQVLPLENRFPLLGHNVQTQGLGSTSEVTGDTDIGQNSVLTRQLNQKQVVTGKEVLEVLLSTL